MASWAMQILLVTPMLRPHRAHPLTQSQFAEVVKLGVVSVLLWSWAAAFIKISVAVMLVRLRQDSRRLWLVFLYTMMALQVAYGVMVTVFMLVACRPFSETWSFDRISSGKCLAPDLIRAISQT